MWDSPSIACCHWDFVVNTLPVDASYPPASDVLHPTVRYLHREEEIQYARDIVLCVDKTVKAWSCNLVDQWSNKYGYRNINVGLKEGCEGEIRRRRRMGQHDKDFVRATAAALQNIPTASSLCSLLLFFCLISRFSGWGSGPSRFFASPPSGRFTAIRPKKQQKRRIMSIKPKTKSSLTKED